MLKKLIVSDVYKTYSYFLIDEETRHGFLVDPGAEAGRLLRIIEDNGWEIEKILLTHGHFDHTGAVEEISQVLGIPYLIHENGKEYLENTILNLSGLCDRNVILRNAQFIRNGDVISLAANEDFSFEVLHAPGHTPDSVLFYSSKEKLAIVGDTIFKGSVGITDYPGGNAEELNDSIRNVVFKLPEETCLHSGHSASTDVGTEKRRYGIA